VELGAGLMDLNSSWGMEGVELASVSMFEGKDLPWFF